MQKTLKTLVFGFICLFLFLVGMSRAQSQSFTLLTHNTFAGGNTSLGSGADSVGTSTLGVSPPTSFTSPSTGGGWIDHVGNLGKILSNQVNVAANGATPAPVYRPSAEDTTDQKIVATSIANTQCYVLLHVQGASHTSYYAIGMANATTFACYSYVNGTYTATLSSITTSSIATPYNITAQAVKNGSGTDIVATVALASAPGTILGTITITGNTTAGLQSVGSVGVSSSYLAFVASTIDTYAVIPAVATGIRLSGPTSGAKDTASTVFTATLTPTGGTNAGVTVTPTDSSGAGIFTPSSVALSTGTSSATFTYKPLSAGVRNIGLTNSGTLTNPTALSYTSLPTNWQIVSTNGASQGNASFSLFAVGSRGGTAKITHVAPVQCVGLRLRYQGIACTSDWQAMPSPLTLKASIEYPAGTRTQVTWGGLSTYTLAPDETKDSDTIAVTIPAGATYFEWTYADAGASGQIPFADETATVTDAVGFPYADLVQYSGVGVAPVDLTMSGTPSGGAGNGYFGAIGILGLTPAANRTAALIGDSRSWGLGDTGASYSGKLGYLRRALAQSYGYVKTSRSGRAVWSFGNPPFPGHELVAARVFAASAGCTNAIIQLGINDLNGARTGANVIADLKVLASKCQQNGMVVWFCTVEPFTTSTDSWATTGNQTVKSFESDRLAVNTWIRTQPNVFDIADATETARNSGIWKANYTGDGLHPNGTANAAEAAVINPALLSATGFHPAQRHGAGAKPGARSAQ